ncbi:hypothetical protein AAFF_G00125480 [Aldrovandia affinis]|uniref:Uncharacterized protein n=1 Tax=Aldrovandia affinis TaxID=143900 RepID=A0AAD7RRP2_9TELE|nr:hypothetical protein AAFF_G00125480 [Aldrovandia affinis]
MLVSLDPDVDRQSLWLMQKQLPPGQHLQTEGISYDLFLTSLTKVTSPGAGLRRLYDGCTRPELSEEEQLCLHGVHSGEARTGRAVY